MISCAILSLACTVLEYKYNTFFFVYYILEFICLKVQTSALKASITIKTNTSPRFRQLCHVGQKPPPQA